MAQGSRRRKPRLCRVAGLDEAMAKEGRRKKQHDPENFETEYVLHCVQISDL